MAPFNRDLSSWGQPHYLKHSEIAKAKQSLMSKEITIRHHGLPRGYIQLNVTEHINQDPDGIVLLNKQDEGVKRFLQFFKGQYKK
jgi:hypothetical protein